MTASAALCNAMRKIQGSPSATPSTVAGAIVVAAATATTLIGCASKPPAATPAIDAAPGGLPRCDARYQAPVCDASPRQVVVAPAPAAPAAPGARPKRRPPVAKRWDTAEVVRRVQAMRAGFRRCYLRGLAQDPTAEGSLDVRIRIGADGKVTQVAVKVTGGTLPASVPPCVQDRAEEEVFPPPPSGKARISVPATFRLQPLDATTPDAGGPTAPDGLTAPGGPTTPDAR